MGTDDAVRRRRTARRREWRFLEETTQEHAPVRWTGPSTFIDGRWREGGETVVYDKYTGEALGAIREATAAEIDLAVAAAERSFRQHRLSPFERYEILHRFSEWVKAREAEIIRLLIAEVGKTYQDTRIEVARA